MIIKRYRCVFCETAGGKTPVEDFLRALAEETQDRFIYKKELLEHFGSHLRQPHTCHLGGGLFELRLKGWEGQIRVLFFFIVGRRIVLVHGFVKKTQKTPKREIEVARKRMKKILR